MAETPLCRRHLFRQSGFCVGEDDVISYGSQLRLRGGNGSDDGSRGGDACGHEEAALESLHECRVLLGNSRYAVKST
jgi:hypothetical protein